ncbi:hypothetical protein SABIM44S_02183 [Streptomyces abikoensis]
MALTSHKVLKSLLGAWALAACSPEETAAVEAHLTDCATCADEAVRLREAVALLHPEDNLDLDPRLRSRVLASCLGRRPARVPVPAWAAPYDAETARLDALLHDIGEAEWQAPVRLRWFDGERPVGRDTTVAAVIGHLTAVDGLVARTLGLPDPLGDPTGSSPAERTEALWATRSETPPGVVRDEWREQGRALIRGASFAEDELADLAVAYGPAALPVRDAFLDRAFECWIHAEDIAEAVDYPYHPPSPSHLHELVGLAARMLPEAIAARRRAGLAPPAHVLAVAGAPGRSLHLEVEGSGGGHCASLSTPRPPRPSRARRSPTWPWTPWSSAAWQPGTSIRRTRRRASRETAGRSWTRCTRRLRCRGCERQIHVFGCGPHRGCGPQPLVSDPRQRAVSHPNFCARTVRTKGGYLCAVHLQCSCAASLPHRAPPPKGLTHMPGRSRTAGEQSGPSEHSLLPEAGEQQGRRSGCCHLP